MMDGESGEALGALLRAYRRRAGLSQVALATRSGLSESAISALERGARGRPYAHNFDRLATALGLTPAERATLAEAGSAPLSTPHGSASASHTAMQAPLPPLPVPATTLIGRDVELSKLKALVCDPANRLVTLIGVGGGGKTRLALAIADATAHAFPDGVLWLELAPLSDGMQVPHAFAAALGVREARDQPLIETLRRVLVDRSMLVVLDNCEHLIEACAWFVAQLLGTCPFLHVLATSREPLQIAGEQQWILASLPVPRPGDAWPPEALAGVPSVQLFVERARAVAPDFVLTTANTTAVVEICRRLDGIPLALELAAARVRTLGVEYILSRLDSSLTLLMGGNRSAPPRQRTLRAALDWSYELLSLPERAFLRYLAVFAGGWDLDAVTERPHPTPTDGDDLWGPAHVALTNTTAEDVDHDPVDLLTRLVDRSLVVAAATDAGTRYRLLEPVRQYAARRLAEAGEEAFARTQHAAWCLFLVEQATTELRGSAQIEWLQRLDTEAENVRSALRWAAESGAAVALARFAIALLPFWEVQGLLGEGRRWVDAARSDPYALPPLLQSRLLLTLARLAFWQVDLAAAETALEEALTLARAQRDTGLMGEGLTLMGEIRLRQRKHDEAARLLEESLPLHVTAENAWGGAWARRNLGFVHSNRGEFARAVSLLEESAREFRALGDQRAAATTALFIGTSRTMLGDAAGGDAALREALHELRAIGDRAFLASALNTLALVRARGGAAATAARLLGAGDSLRRSLGVVLSPVNRATWEEAVAAIRTRMSEADYAATYAEGETLSLDDALAEALAETMVGDTLGAAVPG
jgi:predicted ATPase/transcriptional regulator with XRE-family HTH domain